MDFRHRHQQHQDLVAARDAWVDEEDEDGADPRPAGRRPPTAKKDPFDFDDDDFIQLFRHVSRVMFV